MNCVIAQSIEKIAEYLDKNIISPVISIINSIPTNVLNEYSSDIDKTQCNVKESHNWYLDRLFKQIRNDCDNNKHSIEALLNTVSEDTLKYQFNLPD